ncbi:hypothetical protein [Paraglaciecola sp.]|uniref:hypothetical protein n=1 Tax=Paraglaciecola sp. TaxID=1920173 RepID=UPI0030F45F9F
MKYLLVLSLLLSIGLSLFSESHNPAHVLQTDQHCALCLSAHNLDYSLPLNIPQLLVPLLSEFSVALLVMNYVEFFVRAAGNRDPPFII